MSEICTQCGLPLSTGSLGGKRKPLHQHFCCYGCKLTYQITQEQGEQGKAQGILIRLGLGIFFAMNVMLFSLPTYAPFFFDFESDATFLLLLRVVLIVFSAPVLLLLGLPILLNSLKEIARIYFSLDTLIALGTFAAYGLSIYNTVNQADNVYFDTATMLLVLVTTGRYLEARAKAKTAEKLSALAHGTPGMSVIAEGSVEREIETANIRVDDVVKIVPGQMFPVDGVVTAGSGGVNESSLTGESDIVFKDAGDRVFSGTISVDGSFHVRATRVESESTLARIAKMLEEARRLKAPIERLANRVASIFVPAVISLAAVVFGIWSWQQNFGTGLLNALSVLVVSCPCALGIATPLAIWIAFNRAARRGILLANGEVLERLTKVREIFFDKTGTLTTGNLRFNQIMLNPKANLTESELAGHLTSLAAYSSHPVTKGILSARLHSNCQRQKVYDFKTHPGLGIEGRVGSPDSPVDFLGSRRFMLRVGQEIDSDFEALVSPSQQRGDKLVFWGRQKCVVAVISFVEHLRPEAPVAAEQLRKLGLRVHVLTGDSECAAQTIQQEFKEVDFYAELLPEDKVRIVTEGGNYRGCTTAMVGDGINDAAALAAADAGIAMGTGTDLAREAASVNILSSDLTTIPWLISYARRVRKRIIGNLFWAFVYNLAAIALAALGWLNPLFAALAMIFSSLFVIWNSQRPKKE
ncbi:MAG: heavy metal translocating P-type ATPase [bacterium]